MVFSIVKFYEVQFLQREILLAKLGKGMLFSVEQAFVGRDEIGAPLKTPAWEATAF